MACSCERFLGRDCPDCNHEPPAPFTDEDVERAAEALDPGAFTGPHVESEDWKNRRYDAKTKARRALSAYLET